MPACYGYTWDSFIYPYALEMFPNEVASRYQLLFGLKMTSFKPLMLLSFRLYFHYWVPIFLYLHFHTTILYVIITNLLLLIALSVGPVNSVIQPARITEVVPLGISTPKRSVTRATVVALTRNTVSRVRID